jgi:hypothetical protein
VSGFTGITEYIRGLNKFFLIQLVVEQKNNQKTNKKSKQQERGQTNVKKTDG